MNLRIPGPVPLPPNVLQALCRPMINHRGPEFAAILREVTANLKTVFQTQNDVLIFTASGTGGLEAAVANTLSPGDRVVAASIGFFGERFAEIAQRFGAQVTLLQFPYGQPADPEAVRRELQKGGYRALLVTHNDTSTGITNDLAALSAVAREADVLLLVDGVSSVGATPLPTDAWGCDVVVTASQKALMAPPGLAMVSVSPRAWAAHQQARMPRYYFDFTLAKKYLEIGQTPATPAVSVFFALQESLRLILAEGLENWIARHARIAARTRAGIKALGLRLFGDERYASNAVTAVEAPPGLDVGQLLKVLREEFNIVLAGGQGSLAGKIFRIGHLGLVREEEIDAVLAALRVCLPRLGVPVSAAPRT